MKQGIVQAPVLWMNSIFNSFALKIMPTVVKLSDKTSSVWSKVGYIEVLTIL